MAETSGLFGDGLFGEEFYSAAVREGDGVTVNASSTWLFTAATRLRTTTLSIVAAVVVAFSGFRRFPWDDQTGGIPAWNLSAPGTDPWSPSAAGGGMWLPSFPNPDPWSGETPGSGNWT